MGKCKNCGCRVNGKALFCCYCGYPMEVFRVIPWPWQFGPVEPQRFWKVGMGLFLLLGAVAGIGIMVHAHLGLPCTYCAITFALSLVATLWAYLGAQMGCR